MKKICKKILSIFMSLVLLSGMIAVGAPEQVQAADENHVTISFNKVDDTGNYWSFYFQGTIDEADLRYYKVNAKIDGNDPVEILVENYNIYWAGQIVMWGRVPTTSFEIEAGAVMTPCDANKVEDTTRSSVIIDNSLKVVCEDGTWKQVPNTVSLTLWQVDANNTAYFEVEITAGPDAGKTFEEAYPTTDNNTWTSTDQGNPYRWRNYLLFEKLGLGNESVTEVTIPAGKVFNAYGTNRITPICIAEDVKLVKENGTWKQEVIPNTVSLYQNPSARTQFYAVITAGPDSDKSFDEAYPSANWVSDTNLNAYRWSKYLILETLFNVDESVKEITINAGTMFNAASSTPDVTPLCIGEDVKLVKQDDGTWRQQRTPDKVSLSLAVVDGKSVKFNVEITDGPNVDNGFSGLYDNYTYWVTNENGSAFIENGQLIMQGLNADVESVKEIILEAGTWFYAHSNNMTVTPLYLEEAVKLVKQDDGTWTQKQEVEEKHITISYDEYNGGWYFNVDAFADVETGFYKVPVKIDGDTTNDVVIEKPTWNSGERIAIWSFGYLNGKVPTESFEIEAGAVMTPIVDVAGATDTSRNKVIIDNSMKVVKIDGTWTIEPNTVSLYLYSTSTSGAMFYAVITDGPNSDKSFGEAYPKADWVSGTTLYAYRTQDYIDIWNLLSKNPNVNEIIIPAGTLFKAGTSTPDVTPLCIGEDVKLVKQQDGTWKQERTPDNVSLSLAGVNGNSVNFNVEITDGPNVDNSFSELYANYTYWSTADNGNAFIENGKLVMQGLKADDESVKEIILEAGTWFYAHPNNVTVTPLYLENTIRLVKDSEGNWSEGQIRAGDVHLDDVIDIRDLVAMKHMVSENSAGVLDKLVADLNNSGTIDNTDCELMREMLVDPSFVANGASTYSIVCAEEATENEIFAATEIQYFVASATGADIPIVRETSVSNSAKCIFVGATKAANAAGVAPTFQEVQNNGFVIRTIGDDIYLRGYSDIGTRNAVYEFLNDAFDYECYAYDEIHLMQMSDLILAPINKVVKPAFEWREANYGELIVNKTLSKRMRFNETDEIYVNGHASHNTMEIIDPFTYDWTDANYKDWYARYRLTKVDIEAGALFNADASTPDVTPIYIDNTVNLVKQDGVWKMSTNIVSLSEFHINSNEAVFKAEITAGPNRGKGVDEIYPNGTAWISDGGVFAYVYGGEIHIQNLGIGNENVSQIIIEAGTLFNADASTPDVTPIRIKETVKLKKNDWSFLPGVDEWGAEIIEQEIPENTNVVSLDTLMGTTGKSADFLVTITAGPGAGKSLSEVYPNGAAWVSDEYGFAYFEQSTGQLVLQGLKIDQEFTATWDGGKGDGREQPAQLCFSNDDMREAFTNNLITKYLQETKVSNMQLGMEDNQQWCACDTCAAEKKKYGTDSAVMIKFLNKVQADVNAWFAENRPNDEPTKLLMLAYFSTVNPPAQYDSTEGIWKPIDEEVVLNEDSGIVYAPILARYDIPFTDTAKDDPSTPHGQILGWSAVSDNLFVTTYAMYTKHSFLFFDSFEVMEENYQFLLDNGAKMILDMTEHFQKSGNSGFSRLKAYVMSKMQWDSSLNMEDLIDDFFANYFAEAGETMQELFNKERAKLVALYANNEANGQIFDNLLDTKYWTYEELQEYMALIDEAYEDIKPLQETNPKRYRQLYDRILLESIQFRYILIELYASEYEASELLQMKQDFKTDFEYLKLTTFGESQSIEALWTKWEIE